MVRGLFSRILLARFHHAPESRRGRLLAVVKWLRLEKNLATSIEAIKYQFRHQPFASSGRLNGFIDEALLRKPPAGLRAKVRGWLFDLHEPILSLVFYIDGQASIADLHQPTPAVLDVFPHIPQAAEAGFSVVLPLSARPQGAVTLTFKVVLLSGQTLYGKFDPLQLGLQDEATVMAAIEVRPPGTELRFEQFLATKQTVTFAESTSPKLSVIILEPLSATSLYQSLSALNTQTEKEFEVFLPQLQQDGSLQPLLDRVQGIQFQATVKAAVEAAKGRGLLFLSGSVALEPEAIERILIRLASSEVAAVTGLLISNENRVLEAGGIIASNAELRAYGQGRPKDAPEVQFVREVSSASPALLAVNRAQAFSVDGFSTPFRSRSYQAAHLCLQLRLHEASILYDPKVVGQTFDSFHPFSAEEQSLDYQNDLNQLRAIYQERGALPAQERSEEIARYADKKKGLLVITSDLLVSPPLLSRFLALDSMLSLLQFGQPLLDIPERVECFIGNSPKDIVSLIENRPNYYQAVLVYGSAAMKLYRQAAVALGQHLPSFSLLYVPTEAGDEEYDLVDHLVLDSSVDAKELLTVETLEVTILDATQELSPLWESLAKEVTP